MSQPATKHSQNGRALAQARRKAMSGAGKAAVNSQSMAAATNSRQNNYSPSRVSVAPGTHGSATASSNTGRAASIARRRAASVKGKTGLPGNDRKRDASTVAHKKTVDKDMLASTPEAGARQDCGCGCNEQKATSRQKPVASRVKRKPTLKLNSDSCRATALARRKAHSVRGKAGISQSGMSSAQAARASNPGLSGRDLARALREQKSRKGSTAQKRSMHTGRMRPARNNENGSAQDASWKVGSSNTSLGQTVTGSIVGRSRSVTGDEASTCRDVTGTEYMGADIFKEFCQVEPAKAVLRGGLGETALGNAVTGSRVGRSKKVTGDEPGTCKNITGSEYVDSNQSSVFCASSERKPSVVKQGMSENTKPAVNVTGNENGASRVLTGTKYTGSEDGTAARKVGNSSTLNGGRVTGSMTSRAAGVTGDEPGTCKAITGTPYAGAEQYMSFCDTNQVQQATESMTKPLIANGAVITGMQPAIGGVMTGDEKGACEVVSGTPYIGRDQVAEVCPSTPAEPGSPDFPQLLEDINDKDARKESLNFQGVTGSSYEHGGITGPFGMAPGKVTGTEEARFDLPNQARSVQVETKETVNGRPVSRITGEGMDAGPKITGDDWDRGDRVTGTEGTSSIRRNPTLRGNISNTAKTKQGHQEEVPAPVSKVTGGSGNTDHGALITYSGGARG